MLDDPQRFPVGYVVARAGEPVDWSQVTETIDGRRHKRISVFFESFVRGHSVGTEELRSILERVAELESGRPVPLSRAALGFVVAMALAGLGGRAVGRRTNGQALRETQASELDPDPKRINRS
jgi:hypothetical protein